MFEIETVGPDFEEELIISARDKTLKVIQLASQQIKAGTSEDEGRKIVKALLQEYHCEKSWHASQVRFGVNSVRAFGQPGEKGVVLGENDVYFLDLGPIFGKHEGDVGRTFVMGDDLEMKKIVTDVEKIWGLVRDRWARTEETGAQLYAYAEKVASELGWQLSLYHANGHRIADFPHVIKQRGEMNMLDFKPSSNKWILEIQIKHPTRNFGAFFEDLLQSV